MFVELVYDKRNFDGLPGAKDIILGELTKRVHRIFPDADCSGQLKLATALEFFQYRFSDSFGGNPPL